MKWPLQPGDVAILQREHDDQILARALTRYGYPGSMCVSEALRRRLIAEQLKIEADDVRG